MEHAVPANGRWRGVAKLMSTVLADMLVLLYVTFIVFVVVLLNVLIYTVICWRA